MNKGLELIEAHHLFGLGEERIEILIHPESIVHSLVAFKDGSMLAQLGQPDMRIPIAYTLGWPDRISAPTRRLDLSAVARLTFAAPDAERFPALRLARDTLRQGGAAPTVLNAANEVAVGAFLAGRLGFLDIAALVEQVLERSSYRMVHELDSILSIDAEARRHAETLIAGWTRPAIGTG
jgi:1-deoxy-D-xylulose-5-phosphate reductoisomerase